MTAFEEFGVLPELGKAIDEMDWTLPTDVQAEAIPLILGGGDVLMAAETGSGKTGAFCLPILQIVWEMLKDIQEGKTSKVLKVASEEVTLSVLDRTHALAVTPDGLRCQSRDPNQWHGCRATKGVHTKGAYYYEATVTDEGLCRLGWSTQTAKLDLGTDRLGYGYGGTGKKSNAKQFNDYGSPYGMNDTIGCFLNLNSGEIRYSKNGEDLGVAFKLDQSRHSDCYFPAIVLKNAEMKFNFGSEPFRFPPLPEYLPIAKAPKEYVKENTVSMIGTPDKPTNNAPQAIIIEPSRELAEQTCNQITKFKKYLENPKVRELLVVGGVNVKDQINQLNAGIDIVVGTPGRLEDLIQGGYLALTHCSFFVLDEADGLLKTGYGEMIERLHRQIPKLTSDGRRLQMVVCSATLHNFDVKKLAEKLMHFPTWVDLKGEDAVPETVHHVVVNVDPQKDRSWETLRTHIKTDSVHAKDNIRSGNTTAETLSEAVKLLKGEYCVRAIREHKMDSDLRRRVSYAQLELLWEFLIHNKSLATGYNKTTQAREFSKNMWKKIAQTLNANGDGAKKDWKSWCRYWNDYKSKLKKLVAATRASRQENGGGPPDTRAMTNIEKKFLQVLGEDFSAGLPGMRIESIEEEISENSETPIESGLETPIKLEICSEAAISGDVGGTETILTFCSVPDAMLVDLKEPGPSSRLTPPSQVVPPTVEHTVDPLHTSPVRVTRRHRRNPKREPPLTQDAARRSLIRLSERRVEIEQQNSSILQGLLNELKEIKEILRSKAIIFCRTKIDCDNLERYMKSFGNEFSCVCLHGDRKPNERKANLEAFKQCNASFLICTDVAARGIDISGLPFMINVTLPDEKSNYVHRIGRVGRADRMGLAISLVSTVPEKVWYHGEWCSSRGRNCWNTNLIDDRPKGCCMWYNEPQYLADIEEHLNITIQQVASDMKVPCNEFDGKVVYGQKRKQVGSGYQDHVTQMAPVVKSLQELESQAQNYYLRMHHKVSVA